MSDGTQASFVGVTIDKGKFREDCKHVKSVKDGKRIFCGYDAKFKIEKSNGETDYRCGIHIGDYGALDSEGTYEEMELE